MKNIAIVINARLQSTRCPKKHIRDLGGTTLIDECLKKVESLQGVEEKYLATVEEELIAKLGSYFTINHLSRQHESITKGQVPFEIAFKHYEKANSDYIMIINPCQPLIDPKEYQKAIDWFKKVEHSGAVSVVKKRNYFFSEDGSPANFDMSSRLCSRSGPAMLVCSHSFMFFKKQYFIDNGVLWPNVFGDPFPYVIPDENLFDVDTNEDFNILKKIIGERSGV